MICPVDSAIQCLKNRGLEKIGKSQFLEKRNRKVVEGEVKVVPIVIEALGAAISFHNTYPLDSDLSGG